ncbi:hypothetical protein DL764_009865 [Monosporascus ibericus]|uniref:Ketoreductase (KR) domain-containing protein n=1 Tax=Monosporascus ibericus TaxID=155417 RepID=A0A4Q4SVW9_9PEZI|nr:hypothetical protein DL764_009865 [Monosporascus ibericus]
MTCAQQGNVQFEFIRQLSERSNSVVIGIVRDMEAAERRVKAKLKRTNIHILHRDLVSYESLRRGEPEALERPFGLVQGQRRREHLSIQRIPAANSPGEREEGHRHIYRDGRSLIIWLYGIDATAPYAISKAALNTSVATFIPEQKRKGAMAMVAKFAKIAPHFKSPITPEESFRSILAVIGKASVDRGDGGSFVSLFRKKQ